MTDLHRQPTETNEAYLARLIFGTPANQRPETHLRDVRRPIGGRPAFGDQVPVICAVDILDLIEGGADATEEIEHVSCPACYAIIFAGLESIC